MNANGREQLLDRHGRFYGDEHFAIAFTAGISGDNAKRVVTKQWDRSPRLANGDYGAGLIKERGLRHNIAIVLRPSNLIVIECDTEADLLAIEALRLPPTLTVRSSEPYKRHFYFRPPEELEALPYVAFRFESGKLTADSGRYFLAPPSIHPSGAVYAFLPGLGPGETDVIEMPEAIYRTLCERAEQETFEQRERIRVEPEAKILAGQRRDLIFRYACMLRRWGRPYEAILAECRRFNMERCLPPVADALVEVQVKGAMKKEGDQEFQRAQEPVFELQVLSAVAVMAIPEPADGYELLGPLLLRRGRTIIVGDTGHGKTTVALQMLSAVLSGEEAFGHQGIGEGPVLIVDLEQGVRSIKRGLREAKLDKRHDVLVVTVPDGLALDQSLEEYAALEAVLAEHQPTVTLLDPYYKAHRADDPNAERPIIDLMRSLDRLRVEYGFALLLPAHPRKPDITQKGSRRLTIHDVAGSGAVTRGAEIVLGVERLGHGVARLRYLKDREGELPIGEALPLLYTKQDGFRLNEGTTETDEGIAAKILSGERGWLTAREWAKEIKVQAARVKPILEQLAQDPFSPVVFMLGPPGRGGNAKCYSTVPEHREQSGTAGTQGVLLASVPSAPPLRGVEHRNTSTATAPPSGNSAVDFDLTGLYGEDDDS